MEAKNLGGKNSRANEDTWNKTKESSQILWRYLTQVHWYYT